MTWRSRENAVEQAVVDLSGRRRTQLSSIIMSFQICNYLCICRKRRLFLLRHVINVLAYCCWISLSRIISINSLCLLLDKQQLSLAKEKQTKVSTRFFRRIWLQGHVTSVFPSGEIAERLLECLEKPAAKKTCTHRIIRIMFLHLWWIIKRIEKNSYPGI